MPVMARRIPVLGTFFNVFLGAGTSYREKDPAEAKTWVREQFLRLRGRTASEAEVAEYTRLLEQPGAGLQAVLRAIGENPEHDRSQPS